MSYPESLKLEIADAIWLLLVNDHRSSYILFDYSTDKSLPLPHRVRDSRSNSATYGHTVFSSECAIEAREMYDRLTKIHVAEAVIAVMHRFMASGNAI
jgi:hypothetical protein